MDDATKKRLQMVQFRLHQLRTRVVRINDLIEEQAEEIEDMLYPTPPIDEDAIRAGSGFGQIISKPVRHQRL
jgi:hypothetical protein